MSRVIVSYNNAFRISRNLHMRCSDNFMFANAVVDSCSTCIRKSIFSLMSRLSTSTNLNVQSTINSDVYATSELYQRWGKGVIHLILFTMDRTYVVNSHLIKRIILLYYFCLDSHRSA